MDLDLKALKIDRENSVVEAKKASFSLPKTIWETYSAFANTNGGQILLGVSEDSETKELIVSGIMDPLKVKKEFWDTINNPQKVSHNILSDNDFNEITLKDGKTIFIIRVPRAKLELRPIYINDDILKGSYKRNHEGDYHMTREDVSKMLRDASPYSYDLTVYDDLPLSVLSDETINKYRRYHEGHKDNHPWKNLNKEQYLLMLGAAAFSDQDGMVHPTMAGLLMFGEEHIITRIFPNYFLDYRENLDPAKVKWSDRVQSISGDWSGNIFDFYILINNKLVMDLKVPFRLRGMERVDSTPLHDAVREALINCLSNADYFGRCGIVIKKNVDSIIYENPGSIRVGKEQMMRGGVSDARNKTIMKMFNLLGYGERAGSGIPLIIQATKELGLPTPEVSENIELDRTIFTIFPRRTAKQENEISSDNLELASCNSGAVADNAEIAQDNAEIRVDNAKTAQDDAKTAQDNAERPESSSRGKQLKKEYICKLLESNGGCNSKSLSESTGLSLRRTQELLKELLNEGLIYSEGLHPNKRYFVKYGD